MLFNLKFKGQMPILSFEALLAATTNAELVKKLKVCKEKHSFGKGKAAKNTYIMSTKLKYAKYIYLHFSLIELVISVTNYPDSSLDHFKYTMCLN